MFKKEWEEVESYLTPPLLQLRLTFVSLGPEHTHPPPLPSENGHWSSWVLEKVLYKSNPSFVSKESL